MIKRILIPLDPSPYTDTAVKMGCIMAKLHHAELTGLVVLDIPGINKSIGPTPLGASYYAEKLGAAKQKQARNHIDRLLLKFKKKCDNEGVKHQEAECQGSPSERIISESIYYDAVIIGMRTYFRFATTNKPGDSLDNILDHSITPVYAVPASYTFPKMPPGKMNVLIAFDGSLPAARAIQRFVQLAMPDVMNVLLLSSHDDKETAEYYLDHAEAYLKAYSISNVEKNWTSQNIIAAVENKYLDWADFVVVGAHSKKGLIDFMLGSLTKQLIKLAKKPVLIGQ
jgi:nucleotide-binding universal stress UspA family protein